MTTTTIPRTEDEASFPISPVNRVKRTPDRGRYDKETVYAILDAALVCHIAYVIDGRPNCTPTSFWREGDHLYWHGSSASRMLRTQAQEVQVCLTVTHVDALVMAGEDILFLPLHQQPMAWAVRPDVAHVVQLPDKARHWLTRMGAP